MAWLDLLYDLGSLPAADPFLVGAQKTGYAKFSFTEGGRSDVAKYGIQQSHLGQRGSGGACHELKAN
jgi:hypothetical protein